MLYKNALIVFFLFFFCKSWANQGTLLSGNHSLFTDSLIAGDNGFVASIHQLPYNNKPSPLLKAFRLKQKNNKKTIATLLAFPLPFGIVGLHRIYLGSAPYVPVVYIASLGGVFGILPFIDFCVLLTSKKADPFLENEKIFMWVN